MNPLDIARWVENQRATARRIEQLAARADAEPGESIAAALRLVALYGRLHGWPAPADVRQAYIPLFFSCFDFLPNLNPQSNNQ